jgi:hypothetical protein
VVGRPLGLLVDESDVRWTVAAVMQTAQGVLAAVGFILTDDTTLYRGSRGAKYPPHT